MTSYEIYEPSLRIEKIKKKIREKGVKLNPPIPWEELEAFEKKHGILLPPHYREFILEAGNGGDGPAAFGIVPLGTVPDSMNDWEKETWSKLEHIQTPFPFTKEWQWEPGDWERDGFEENEFKRIHFGNIALGGDHWNIQYHLIVTGPARGSVWVFHEDGVYPLKGMPDFDMWYEAGLDGNPYKVQTPL